LTVLPRKRAKSAWVLSGRSTPGELTSRLYAGLMRSSSASSAAETARAVFERDAAAEIGRALALDGDPEGPAGALGQPLDLDQRDAVPGQNRLDHAANAREIDPSLDLLLRRLIHHETSTLFRSDVERSPAKGLLARSQVPRRRGSHSRGEAVRPLRSTGGRSAVVWASAPESRESRISGTDPRPPEPNRSRRSQDANAGALEAAAAGGLMRLTVGELRTTRSMRPRPGVA
jgi:hypothetical protein